MSTDHYHTDASGSVVAITNPTGSVVARYSYDAFVYRYVYAPDGTPLALERTSAGAPAELFSYHTDAHGSVVAITGPSGAVVASCRYDAFGAVTSATGSDPVAERNPLRYRAYYLDAATGLYYLPARSYDPATARFLSPDPAPPAAGDPLSLNRYAYCEGDPVNFTDPDGARHEAGSGVGAPVVTEAIEYAKSGDMDAATAVQTAYRDGLRDGYAAGYDYDRAHALAERAAQEARVLDIGACGGYIVGGAMVYAAGWSMKNAGLEIIKAGARVAVAGFVGEEMSAGASSLAVGKGAGVMAIGAGVRFLGSAIQGSGSDMISIGWTGRPRQLMVERVFDYAAAGDWGAVGMEWLNEETLGLSAVVLGPVN